VDIMVGVGYIQQEEARGRTNWEGREVMDILFFWTARLDMFFFCLFYFVGGIGNVHSGWAAGGGRFGWLAGWHGGSCMALARVSVCLWCCVCFCLLAAARLVLTRGEGGWVQGWDGQDGMGLDWI